MNVACMELWYLGCTENIKPRDVSNCSLFMFGKQQPVDAFQIAFCHHTH